MTSIKQSGRNHWSTPPQRPAAHGRILPMESAPAFWTRHFGLWVTLLAAATILLPGAWWLLPQLIAG